MATSVHCQSAAADRAIVADYVGLGDRGAAGAPADAVANLVLSLSPSLQQPSSRPPSPLPSHPRSPSPTAATSSPTPPSPASRNVPPTAALTSVAVPPLSPAPPIASPLSALATRTRRRPLLGLLARGHRRRSNTLDTPSRPVFRAPQHTQPGTPNPNPSPTPGTGTNQSSPSPAPTTSLELMTTAQPHPPSQQQRGQPVPASAQAQEPATLTNTKASLKTWWNHFTFAQRAKKEAEEKKSALAPGEGVVFGKPLKESLKYASVQISTANSNGELYVWGYIPVVVAKCGLFLKENATEVEGTFRVSGSNKRMRELQAAFETPPRYGKSLDWQKEQFTTHDVASVFRRYLTQMPESVIPHDMYHLFRNALAKQPQNEDEIIATYKRLIRSMPRANQYLLLYVLDLLSVFARKSDKNLMTAKNLAVIFRPALIAHPTHEMSPQEHHLSQDVLEFLIKHQDWFMLDIPPPPTTRPSDSAVTVPMADPVDLLSSSDEESGGWKLVSRETPDLPKKIGRRRTTTERSGEKSPVEGGNLSPVVETPPSRSNSVVTVTRSRTLPSSKTRIPEEERHAKLVKKQKRASVQPHPGRTASGGGGAHNG